VAATTGPPRGPSSTRGKKGGGSHADPGIEYREKDSMTRRIVGRFRRGPRSPPYPSQYVGGRGGAFYEP